jgi:hypothetical protein
VTKAELNIQTSNTQSKGKRPRQLLGEVLYKGAKTSGKRTGEFCLADTNHPPKPYPNILTLKSSTEKWYVVLFNVRPFVPKGKKRPSVDIKMDSGLEAAET